MPALRSTIGVLLSPRAFRFLVLGFIGMACDLTTFYVVYVRVGAPVVIGSGAAWSCASTVLFVVARLWVFPDAQTTIPVSSFRYVALIVGNGLVTVSFTSLLVGPLGFPYVAIRVFMSAVIIPINYLISQRWVFETPT